jgi:hypothetical protein
MFSKRIGDVVKETKKHNNTVVITKNMQGETMLSAASNQEDILEIIFCTLSYIYFSWDRRNSGCFIMLTA